MSVRSIFLFDLVFPFCPIQLFCFGVSLFFFFFFFFLSTGVFVFLFVFFEPRFSLLWVGGVILFVFR